MKSVIEYALGVYRNKEKWTNLVKNVMNTDFSWRVSAKKYIDIYNAML